MTVTSVLAMLLGLTVVLLLAAVAFAVVLTERNAELAETVVWMRLRLDARRPT